MFCPNFLKLRNKYYEISAPKSSVYLRELMVGRIYSTYQKFLFLSFSTIHLEITICSKRLFQNSNSSLKFHIQHFGCFFPRTCIRSLLKPIAFFTLKQASPHFAALVLTVLLNHNAWPFSTHFFTKCP